jgi:hypothetical protein
MRERVIMLAAKHGRPYDSRKPDDRVSLLRVFHAVPIARLGRSLAAVI